MCRGDGHTVEQPGRVRAECCPQRIPQVLPARAVNEPVFNGFGKLYGVVAWGQCSLWWGGKGGDEKKQAMQIADRRTDSMSCTVSESFSFPPVSCFFFWHSPVLFWFQSFYVVFITYPTLFTYVVPTYPT